MEFYVLTFRKCTTKSSSCEGFLVFTVEKYGPSIICRIPQFCECNILIGQLF